MRVPASAGIAVVIVPLLPMKPLVGISIDFHADQNRMLAEPV
jgi:hypothetical protein